MFRNRRLALKGSPKKNQPSTSLNTNNYFKTLKEQFEYDFPPIFIIYTTRSVFLTFTYHLPVQNDRSTSLNLKTFYHQIIANLP